MEGSDNPEQPVNNEHGLPLWRQGEYVGRRHLTVAPYAQYMAAVKWQAQKCSA